MRDQKTPVRITITSRQFFPDGSVDRNVVHARGTLAGRGGRHFLLYDEKTEEDSGAVTSSILRFHAREASVTRRGTAELQLHFQEGEHDRTEYRNAYGSMMIDIDTGRLQLTESDTALTLLIEYDLAVEGKHAARCRVRYDIASDIASEKIPPGRNG